MPDDPRITLIFDPFNICERGETRVGSFVEEKQAFREIEQLLLRDERFDTVQPKTFVIDNRCWQHFRTYHGVQGVRIEEVTPRTRLGDWIGEEPPDWLLNQDIRRWRLLEASGRSVWQGADGQRRSRRGLRPASRMPIRWPIGSAWRPRQRDFPPRRQS